MNPKQKNMTSTMIRDEGTKEESTGVNQQTGYGEADNSHDQESSTYAQSFLLLFIFVLDIIIVSHMIIENSSEKMYFFYGVKFYIQYPNRPWTLAHACIGVIPLILCLSQISSVIRGKSIKFHKNVGRLLIVCSLLQIPTTIYLGINWAEKEIVDIMRALFVVFAFLWGIWGIAVLYYIKWKRDVDLHRQWAVRFAVICHFVPIFGRLLVVIVWYLSGHPEDEDGKIDTLHAALWTLTATFFPLQEFFVWLECGTCWLNGLFASTTRSEDKSLTGRRGMVRRKDCIHLTAEEPPNSTGV